jgi:transcriptional regulator with XRE-family HTH domain
MSRKLAQVPLRGDRLRMIRERRGLSQRELSRRCDLGETAIYRMESAIGQPSADTVARVARELRVSMDFLMGASDKETGQLSENALTPDQERIVKAFEEGGWTGVGKLIFERLAQQLGEDPDIASGKTPPDE